MAGSDLPPSEGQRLETIPSVDPSAFNAPIGTDNEGALRKLTNGSANGHPTENGNGTTSSDLETAQEEKRGEQTPQRSTWKITLIMSSLCVRSHQTARAAVYGTRTKTDGVP